MKTIKNRIKQPLLILFLIIMSASCSDDNPFEAPINGGPNNGDNGPRHLYELTFTGGAVDGEAFSGSFPDNMILAYRHQTPDGEGGEIDSITLNLAEEAQSNDFNLAMLIRMNGNTPLPLNDLDDDNESHMAISYNDYILNATSGTITMTDLGQITYQGITYPHFRINYTAQINGGTLTSPNTFTTEVSGTITVRRLDVN